MPALSNGNTCWGNRKAFNMHSEYICDSFALGNVFDSSSSATQSFVSSNSYYGFHRVPNEPVEEAMALDVSEDLQSPICEDNAVASCRKRPNSAEQRVDSSKRIRHQEVSQPPPLQSTSYHWQHHLQSTSSQGSYDLKKGNFVCI